MTVSLVGRMAIGRSSSLCPDLVTQATYAQAQCRPERPDAHYPLLAGQSHESAVRCRCCNEQWPNKRFLG